MEREELLETPERNKGLLYADLKVGMTVYVVIAGAVFIDTIEWFNEHEIKFVEWPQARYLSDAGVWDAPNATYKNTNVLFSNREDANAYVKLYNEYKYATFDFSHPSLELHYD